MTSVSYPGVYIEEVPGGARPIEAAGTSTAAFVGVAERGPLDRALRITSWGEYQRHYGDFVSGGYLAEGVYQFFNNGGRQCYVIRVNGGGAVAAALIIANRAAAPTAGIQLQASSVGEWGNSLYVKVSPGTNDSGNTFALSVYQQAEGFESEIPSSEQAAAATPLEVHDNLSVDSETPDYFVDRIADASRFITARLDPANVVVGAGSHLSGPGPATTLPAGLGFLINLDGDGFQPITLPAAATTAAMCTAIATAVSGLTRRRSTTPAATFTGFTCVPEVTGGVTRLRLTSGTVGPASSVRIQRASTNNATGLLRLGEGGSGVSFDGLSQRRPAEGVYAIGDQPTNATRGADDITALVAPTSFQNAFTLLDRITDVSLLAVPGVPNMFDAGVTYCENRPLRDLFFIGETALTDDTPTEAEAFRKNIAKPNTYGAIYFPWIKAPDPAGRQAGTVPLPPSGFIAGIFARIDSTRGVWKAPAGTEASLSGASGLLLELTDIEQGNLNRIGVNCIRRFDLGGIVSWGSRTVHSDPEYKYVPVRRTAIMLRRSIYDGIQWAVFEPNDHRLWSSLRLNISAFMNGLFRAGGFQGQKSSDAYFVRCNLGETMTQDDIDRGIVIVEVGFAPLKPAEFVIVRIQQKAGQS